MLLVVLQRSNQDGSTRLKQREGLCNSRSTWQAVPQTTEWRQPQVDIYAVVPYERTISTEEMSEIKSWRLERLEVSSITAGAVPLTRKTLI